MKIVDDVSYALCVSLTFFSFREKEQYFKENSIRKKISGERFANSIL